MRRDSGPKRFYPSIESAGAALLETKGFLERVYEGSVSLMVDAMANSKCFPGMKLKNSMKYSGRQRRTDR